MMRASEVYVATKELYRYPERVPVKYGCLDLRLGTSEKDATCETCGNKLLECIGHFGYVKLELPVFHIGYLRNITTILNSVCKKCSRILLSENERKMYLTKMRNPKSDNLQRQQLLKKIMDECKKHYACERCGNMNGLVKKIGIMKLSHEKYKGTTVTKKDLTADFFQTFDEAIKFNKDIKPLLPKVQEDLNPLDVLRIFERIPAEDVEVLNMDPKRGRPERLLLHHIMVPPVCIRPSVNMDAAGSNEDDITVKLTEIIHLNSVIRTAMQKGGRMDNLMNGWELLQLECALLINGELPGLKPDQKPTKPLRSFVQRLKGKQGRFRGNLSGKRVDFSGRTVISPDPNLRIDEVAIPELVAKVMTYPEKVTPHNMELMQKLVINGPDVHPGAKVIICGDGVKKNLKFGNRVDIASKLRFGDTIERHLMTGDLVLFNRQPSLHKISIMCHRVRVMPWRTFRFNECVCTPYNADFDGDEMNIHLPQTEEAKAEAITLMGVVNNLITPRNGEPIIAATQDFLSTGYLLTRKDTFYDRAQFCLICTYAFDANEEIDLPPPCIRKPVELWTGKQVFNVLIRPNLKSRIVVTLENRSKSYSEKDVKKWGYIEQLCPRDGYVYIRNSELLSGLMDKNTLGSGNKNNIFYVIMRDYSPIDAAIAMTRLSKLSARWIGNQGFSIGISDVQPSDDLRMKKEKLVNSGYATCDDLISQYNKKELESLPGCSMEQTLETKVTKELSGVRDAAGELCISELHPTNTPLIMALCGSKGSNINISQMIACVGQQTLSGSRIPYGFINRTLPHFELNAKDPAARGFVSNSFYTGLTPSEFFFHTMGGREGLVDTAVKTAETGYMQRRLMKALEDLSVHYDDTVRNARGGVVQFTYGDDGLDPAAMEGKDKPVDFKRVFNQIQAKFPSPEDDPLFPADIHDMAEAELASKDFAECSDAFKTDIRSHLEEFAKELVRLRNGRGFPTTMKTHYKDEIDLDIKEDVLARLIEKMHRLTKTQLKHFLKTCHSKYQKARCEPGTAVGAIGAQSIGEPGTQMTLKTFHFAGVASMNITQGVPRIREIINASKTISTPIITAGLHISDSLKTARIVKGRIEKTTLGQVAAYIKEVFKPSTCYISIRLDMKIITALQLEVDTSSIKESILVSKKLKLKSKNVGIKDSEKLRVFPTDDSREGMHYNLENLKNALSNVIVKGIAGVERAVLNQVKDGKYGLFVEGNELLNVMATAGVKGDETKSNHIIEMEKVLGIEAARQTIMNEIQGTMNAHGMSIDTRHVMLLADVMTSRGEVLGITRFGVAKMKDSVLALASFEKTSDHLFAAAVHSRVERIEGISERIIMGMTVPLGTGLFKILQKPGNPQMAKKTLLLDNPSEFSRWNLVNKEKEPNEYRGKGRGKGNRRPPQDGGKNKGRQNQKNRR
eukprot:TRINITY_DN2305_c0_g1_i1.p1 TRINITY_DN2305_c0_g1~~TRINITY_DN2305_c0_g1_i1.p1  ORF type:complete len:1461 (+),score=465.40 TRINITY_DN2305_c0_g1_i1:140-4384(+)